MRKEYSDCQKTKYPACCGLKCCGNHFGGHCGNTKRLIRRYYRHSIKTKIRKEIQSELDYVTAENKFAERRADMWVYEN
jgi:hypothetical protein